MKQILAVFLGSAFGAGLCQAEVRQATADSIQNMLNEKSSVAVCQTCSVYTGQTLVGGISNLLFLVAVIALATAWLYRTKRKIWVIAVGALLSIALLGSYFITPLLGEPPNAPGTCPITVPLQKEGKTSSGSIGEIQVAEASVVSPGLEDEFQAVSDASAEFIAPEKTWKDWLKDSNVYDPLGIFILIAVIGFLIKFPRFRKTRGLFLVASIAYLGFYRGACPCMISSFENAFLYFGGAEVTKVSLLWFLVLIPATFLFGKIWCGWLCHLGALQEVLYHSPRIQYFNTERWQKFLRILQIFSLIVLVTQLLITRTNIFCHYDPFKVAYNLQSSTTLGYVLLGLLLVSSVLIHRPFCRGFCPVGLILGWVSHLPGARRLIKDEACVNCLNCSKECKSHALEHHGKKTTLNQTNCILCGECMDHCHKKLLYLGRKK